MAQEKKAKTIKAHPSEGIPDQVIAVLFKDGVPQLQTNGDLQTWHFMTAVAFLEDIILQNVLRKSLQQAKAMETAVAQGSLPPAVVDFSALRKK